MGIDLRTLILILGITHLMQVLVFAYQYKANKKYGGPKINIGGDHSMSILQIFIYPPPRFLQYSAQSYPLFPHRYPQSRPWIQ